MAEEKRKGVIIEFDFAAAEGAKVLYKATEKVLKDNEIDFSTRIEAQYLAGGNYFGGLREYFAAIKSKKAPDNIAKELAARFSADIAAVVPKAVTADFKAFVKRLLEKGLRVVVATRANLDSVRSAFAEFDSPDFDLYQEVSNVYGSVKWDAWRRAAVSNHLISYCTLAVAGSGYSVKGALLAGMGVVGVMNDHVAYQDFGGANEIFTKLDASAADKVCRVMKV